MTRRAPAPHAAGTAAGPDRPPGHSGRDEFPAVLDALLERRDLDADAARQAMERVLAGDLGPERLAALLTALRAKGVTGTELVGMAQAMRAAAVHVDAGPAPVLDNCGTGGAPCKTVNLSTASAFALAGAGITVAKHGNRSITRPSGSADVLEKSGVPLDLPPDRVEGLLREVGIAFLFAPAFHPAMRHAAPVRKALGVRTVFNLLGPLTNPAGATHQVLGVPEPDLVPLMADALAGLGVDGFVLHGAPGFDEATACAPVRCARVQDGRAGPVTTVDLTGLGLERARPEDLLPVAPDQAVPLLQGILAGNVGDARAARIRDAIAANTAFGLLAVGKARDLQAGLAQAFDVLDSGAGKAKWDALVAAAKP